MSDQDLMKSLEFMSIELGRWKEKYIKLAELCASNKSEDKINIKPSVIRHLEWVYNRLHKVHKESENLDYMVKLDIIIDDLNKLIP